MPDGDVIDREWGRMSWRWEQSDAEEGEHAMILARSQRWAREARERAAKYDPIAELPARPMNRVLGLEDDRYEDPPSVFPDTARGE